MLELEESDEVRLFRALSLGITLSFPHLTGIDVEPVMRTTAKPALGRAAPCSVWKLDITDEDECSGSRFGNAAEQGAQPA